MVKEICCQCQCKSLAVWMYMPSDRDGEYLYCEEHVPSRGCDCNIKEDGSQSTDSEGRKFPCCEYDYNEKGFEVEDLD